MRFIRSPLRRWLIVGLLGIVLLAGASIAYLEDSDRPSEQPVPDHIVLAWESAGFQVGWMGERDPGPTAFRSEPTTGDVQTFRHIRWEEGIGKRLPPPPGAFGLYLFDTRLTDAHLADLTRLRQLRCLDASYTPVTDDGLQCLASLKNLRMLNLGGTKITGDGLQHLTGLKDLHTLRLGSSQLANVGLEHIGRLRSVEVLDISHTQVTNAGLQDERTSFAQPFQETVSTISSPKWGGRGVSMASKNHNGDKNQKGMSKSRRTGTPRGPKKDDRSMNRDEFQAALHQALAGRGVGFVAADVTGFVDGCWPVPPDQQGIDPWVEQYLQESVLRQMAVPDHPRVYCLGSRATRVTFSSQQHRAFNLIWGLRERGHLPADTHVGIVGGGLAGITAAAAARQLGAQVTLLEAKGDVLHFQRGSQMRFVHPNIYDWPEDHSEHPLTDLPCLNWGAGMAGRVAETVLRQWEQTAGIATLFWQEVCHIRYLADGRPVVCTRGAAYRELPFDIVILAVGFGLEHQVPGVPVLSYWENDNFGRAVISGRIPRRYFVSGCGDGGLIDAIRLRLRDFDHSRFTQELLSNASLAAIRDRLREIDSETTTLVRENHAIVNQVEQRLATARAAGGPHFDEGRERKSIEDEIQGHYIFWEYERLPIPKDLVESLRNRLRQDTEVTLNSSSTSPMTLRAAIINRFAVFLLLKDGKLDYLAGRATVIPSLASTLIRVQVQRDGLPSRELEVEEFVRRHGPDPAIDRLFPKRVADALRPGSDLIADPARRPLYPAAFLHNEAWVALKRRVILDYAAENAALVSRPLFDSVDVRQFTVEPTPDGARYAVVIGTPPGPVDPQEGQTVAGISIVYQWAEPPEAPPAAAVAIRNRRARPLVCGLAITNVTSQDPTPGRRQPRWGTLGCFVRMSDGKVGLLSSANVLGHRRTASPGDLIAQPHNMAPQPGDEIAKLEQVSWPAPTALGGTFAAHSVVPNRLSAGAAVLLQDVNHVPGFGDLVADAPVLQGPARARSGQRVLKVGAGSGLTYGRIAEIDIGPVSVNEDNETYWYEGLFSVAGENDQPFTIGGDAGAVVLAEDGHVLGLVIAGSGRRTIACHIGIVLKALDCSLVLPQAAVCNCPEGPDPTGLMPNGRFLTVRCKRCHKVLATQEDPDVND